MTSLVMAAFLFAGLFGYFALPVNELPNVDFPTIVVSASLPGADAETMASAVATPLESAVLADRRPRLDELDQRARRHPDHAAVPARPQHRRRRPGRAVGDRGRRAATAAEHAGAADDAQGQSGRELHLPDHRHARRRCRSPPSTNTPRRSSCARSPSIDGVAKVDIFGQAHPAVRIQVDPDALAARGIGIDQVAAAVSERQCQSRDRSARRPVALGHHPDARASSPRPPTTARRSSPIATARRCASAMSRTSSTASRTRGFRAPITASPASRSASTASRAPTPSPWSNAIKAALPGIRAQLPPSINLDDHARPQPDRSAPPSTTCR